ncbi:type IX secretion system sortase PorU, partial [Cyclobacteriaceae bacterium]|nr:type IX secretion system sortase PorU [Cyclobacteriaceae bacterium]
GTTGYEHLSSEKFNFSEVGNTSVFDATITFNKHAGSSPFKTIGYLDHAAIQYKQQLGGLGQQNFRSFESLNQLATTFTISGGVATIVWNVTDIKNPIIEPTVFTGGEVSFVENDTELNEYLVFNLSEAYTPARATSIVNQNLHGVSVPNIVFLTYDGFEAAAEELASYRERQGYSTLVVTPQEIYNEFSNASADITAIRDFLKSLYDRSPDEFKYLVIVGAASYDYKNRLDNNTNYVATYQSRESLHNVRTYASDDFYGFLRDGDGEWSESPAVNHPMMIGVGRLPVTSLQEAYTVVDKIKRYENGEESHGSWKNKVALIADDGDNNLHVRDANKLSVIINDSYPDLHVTKLYIDAFEQISQGGKESSPEFNDAFTRFVEEGGLIVNYTGHGSPVQWGYEQMINFDFIENMTNENKLPLFVTATCDFGVYDDPSRQSGAMRLVNKGNGGAIGVVTTTRAVYASSNYVINQSFYNRIFTRGSDSSFSSIGYVFRDTKNGSMVGVNNRGFTLLGDPCVKIQLAENKVIITSVNGQNVSSMVNDTVKALSINTISGQVTTSNEDLIVDFNGVLKATIYDKMADKATLGSVDSPFDYQERSNIIYDGLVTVIDGEFTVEFPVSKDISYDYDFGIANFYALDSSTFQEAVGNYKNLIVGGTDENAIIDNEAPIAELFLNDFSFQDGDYTHHQPLLLARLSDDNGINLSSSGIGHEITLMIDDDPSTTIVLNSYYTSELDSYQEGLVRYPMSQLSPGYHTIKLIAWDTHNNAVVEELSFYVGEKVSFHTAPNPFSDYTTLNIEHSEAGKDVLITLQIVNELGQTVMTDQIEIKESPTVIDNIIWDGSFNGEPCASGVYILRINLYYPESGKYLSEISKVLLVH